MLIIFSGLPAAGKTTVALELARQLDAVYLRIDSIEQAIRDSGGAVEDVGYRVGYAVAEDNLRLGRTVVADCVNPWPMTRDAWVAVADRAQVRAVEVEITCSDPDVHRTRAESRTTDISGLVLPTWQKVIDRDYRPWNRERLVIDTARQSAEQSVALLLTRLPSHARSRSGSATENRENRSSPEES